MKKTNRYLIVCVIIIALAMVPVTRRFLGALSYRIARPFVRVFSDASRSSRGFLGGILEIKDLRQQNEELTEKLRQNQIGQSEIAEIEAENQILKNQLGFKETVKERELVPAKIIFREPTTFLDQMVVDKGESSGVIVGLPVVSDGALVGRVSEVFLDQSKVTLITSNASIIQTMLQNSRVMGIMKGGLSGVSLENIPQDTEVVAHEKVVTSGLGGGIGQGILIGEVTGQRSSKSEIFKVLNIQPTVDFSKLELVFILK